MTETVWDTISGIGSAIWTTISGIGSAIWTWLAGVGTTARAIWDNVVGMGTTIWDTIDGIGNTIWTWLSGINNAARTIWTSITSLGTGTWAIIDGIGSSIWTWLAGVGSVARDIWDDITGMGGPTWTTISGIGSAVWTWLGGVNAAARAIWSDIIGMGGTIWDTVSGMAASTWTWIDDNITALQSLFGSTVTSVSNTLLSGWNALFGDPTSTETGGSQGDIDVGTFDLRRVDRIFFDSNDNLDFTSTLPHVSGLLNNLIFYVPTTQTYSWYVSNTLQARLTDEKMLLSGSLRISGSYSGTAAGHIWRDGSHLMAYSGGAERSFSDIGESVISRESVATFMASSALTVIAAADVNNGNDRMLYFDASLSGENRTRLIRPRTMLGVRIRADLRRDDRWHVNPAVPHLCRAHVHHHGAGHRESWSQRILHAHRGERMGFHRGS